MSFKDKIKMYAVLNALKFSGKASAGPVIGQLLSEDSSLKKDMKNVSILVNEILKEVNSMSLQSLKSLADKYPKLEKKQRGRGLKDLPGAVMGKVATRIAPAPSGRLHIGHAYQTLINFLYARKYKGKFILRLEDTNPDNVELDAYDAIKEEVNWITEKGVDKVIIQSDRMRIYYSYVEKLLDVDAVYVCGCDVEVFRELIGKKKSCPCRGEKDQKARWKKMFKEYKQGDAVMRVKTDVKHKNPALRDFPIVRINDSKHPRTGTKYRVWPLMNLSVFVDDVETGVTHAIRGKDHMDNAKRQEYLYDYLGLKKPVALFNGRINFFDLEVSKTKTKEKIAKGMFTGWDDVRLPFLAALKRRGFQAKAFHRWVEELGFTQVDKKVSKKEFFKTLNSFNKDVLEASNRYFFVKDPVEIVVDGASARKVNMRLHPDHKDRGVRVFESGTKFFVSAEDCTHLKNNAVFRLIDNMNVLKKNKKFTFSSLNYGDFKKSKGRLIHWLPATKNLVKIEVLMDDGKTVSGLGEAGISKLKIGGVCQFERFGFVRLDKKDNGVCIFAFAHR